VPQPEHSANVRRNHGKKCLRAKEGEQQTAVSQAVESGSCEPSAPQVSCSCCSPPNFLPADSPLFGASSSGSNTTCAKLELAEATLRHGTVELMVAQAETSAEKALGAVKDAKIARLRLNAS